MHFTDQLNRIVELPKWPPKRILSIVPSQTELLSDLGLDEEIIGITKFCVHPDNWFRNKQRVGGTKKLNIQLIRQLQPDLIIANKEENNREEIQELEKEFPVWISDIKNLADACDMILRIGELVGKPKESEKVVMEIQECFKDLESIIEPQTSLPAEAKAEEANVLGRGGECGGGKLQTIYLIWKDPYMTVGGDTFIHDMIKFCGFENIFESEPRYPEISVSQLSSVNCQLLLLSSEPYPFKEKHIDELKSQLPNTQICLVDGEMFSWYGSRLRLAPAYFRKLHELVYNH
jgi:ABC-type Fe3+-hydroxamate transport system substrate-binding protein